MSNTPRSRIFFSVAFLPRKSLRQKPPNSRRLSQAHEKENPHPHVCLIRHGRRFFLRRISASKIIALKLPELSTVIPSPRYKKIRTLTYVQSATVAGGSAASIEGASPLRRLAKPIRLSPLKLSNQNPIRCCRIVIFDYPLRT